MTTGIFRGSAPWKDNLVRSKRVRDYLAYVAVRILICLVQALRIETGRTLATHLAWFFADMLRLRGSIVDDNLRQAFPELNESRRRELARHMWEHLFLLVLEVAHASRKIHETNWRSYIRLNHADRLVRALLEDRPVLIVTGHFGNFEVAGFVLGILGFSTYTVARTLDNPYLDRYLNSFRGQTGQYIVPKKGAYDQIAKIMERGGTLTLLADQHAGRKGCWVEFFGRPASTHKAIALLALEHDAPIAVVGAPRAGDPLELELEVDVVADPCSMDAQLRTVPDLTQWYTRHLERIIRRAPNQYWWLHRRWKDARSRRRSGRKKAA